MEEVLKTNDDSRNQYDFEENENDSDLEGRLYAEIYFSNEIHETNEKFEDDSIRTIQDIKNATHCCISSTSQSKSSSKGIQNLITTEEVNKKNEHQLSQDPDKNLNLEKQKNFDITIDNTPSRISNEIVNKSLNSQQKLQKSPKNKFEIMKDSKNNSPILKNGQNQNNSPKNTYNSPAKMNTPSTTIPKSAKRKSKNDKDYESARKRSVEYCESIDVDSDSQIYPVVLNSKKSWSGDNLPIISDGAMNILFPKGWKEKKKIDDAEKAKSKKRKNSKSSKTNTTEVGEKKQETEKEDVIDITSSESSDDSSINDTRKLKKRIEDKGTLPIWLNSSSDSEESILEVPIPPKPTPPLVNLKDSDTNTSDSDDGIYDLNCLPAKKKFQSKSDDSEQSLENKNTTEIEDNLVQNSQENSKTLEISESSYPTSENYNSDNSERNISNSQSSFTTNSNISSRNCSYVTVDSGDESSSIYADEEDNEAIQDLILNCTLPNSSPSRLKMGKSTADQETRNEYFEPLNDNPQPSTSKVKISKNLKMKSSREKTDEEYFFEPMIGAVKAFYNNSWGGENYSVEEVRSKMSKNPKHWTILDDDWKPSLRQQRYFLNKAKCTLCRQSGHFRANCPEPKKSPICHMCGSQGHYETRCPSKICLTCGRKQHSYRKTCEYCTKLNCSLCRSKGHKKETCPDLWRQYHHTTNHSEHKTPTNSKEVMKPSHLLICCNCTKWGHEFYNCPKYRWTPHYPTPAHVQNYKKVAENSMTSVQVINLDESATSSQSLTEINETLENGESVNNTPSKNSNKIRTSGTPIKNSNILIKSNFVSLRKPNLDTEKLIFECEYSHPPKIHLTPEEFNREHKKQMCLNDIKNANVEELIAGRTSFAFLKNLSKYLKCDIYITVTQDSKIILSVTFYELFSDRNVFKKIINFWLESPKTKKQIMRKIPRDKTIIAKIFQARLDKFNEESKSVEECFNYLKETSLWLKENQDQSKKPEFNKKKKEMISIRNLLITMLYKLDCGVEKKAFSKMEIALNLVSLSKRVKLNSYISLYYYYHLIFSDCLPTNLVQMLNKYFTLKAMDVNVSLNDIVFNENQESAVEIVEHENNESIEENSSPNKLPSLVDFDMTMSPNNFQQKRNVFTFPDADFIPISTSTSNFITPTTERNVKYYPTNVQNSPQYQLNISGKSNKKLNKNSKKFRKLKKEATIYMNEALQINEPKVTKAAIKIGDLITQTTLQRKHVTFLKNLCIKSQKKMLKKSSKKRSFSNF
ncbi:uncharacterized protein LOC122509281 [Leptopilina heterotoma]|uniref:uncharacterized protein LOC122509281 n=1 Tax=Leptopilina heterotoma TaxID=63436 RepID=UPI001CA8AAD8|nr:uncharacterized protein LOC122509281 [Leptopilina heterotoma]